MEGAGEHGEAQPRVRTVSPRRPRITRASVTPSPALVSGGNGASRRCPRIMQVRVESRRKSFGSSSWGSHRSGGGSGLVQAVSGSQCADPKENHIFTFQLQHNHLRWSKFCSLTVYRGLKSAQRSRRSCSFDIFASLLRPDPSLNSHHAARFSSVQRFAQLSVIGSTNVFNRARKGIHW